MQTLVKHPFCALLTGVVLTCLPLLSQAHRGWIMPAATVFSGEDPWVSFDAAVSNDIFIANHGPLRLDNLQIQAPDGSLVQPANSATLKSRVSFDLNLKQVGTYRIATASGGLMARWESDTGERRFWPERGKKADPAEFKDKVPKKAKNLEVSYNYRRVETYVTRGAPSQSVLKPTNQGLELAPITHPNDLFAGEAAQFVFLIDGKPAAGTQVSVVADGSRYRNRDGARDWVADKDGKVSITWPVPGKYFLEAEYSDNKAAKPAKTRKGSYTLVLEVLPQ